MTFFPTLDFAPSTFFVRLRITSNEIIIDKTYSSFLLIVMKSFILFLGFAIVALTYAQQRDDCLDCVSDVVDAMEFCQVLTTIYTIYTVFYIITAFYV